MIDVDEIEDQDEQEEPEDKPSSYVPAMAAANMGGDGEGSNSGPGPARTMPLTPADAKNNALAYMPAMAANPPGPPAPMATSPQAKDLGDFAVATGTTTPAPQTPLERVGPIPQPPATNPDLATTEADLRAHSAVTPKYDPNTGQTLDQYKPGLGSRIGRGVLDYFTGGGVKGVLKGAFGDRNAPGYFGKGAVNSQYFRDEAARQQAEQADQAKITSMQREDTTAQRDYKNKLEAYKDETGAAAKQTVADEKARHDQETEKLTGQLRDTQQENTDIKQQLADAKDPATKMSAESDARAAIAKKMGLRGQAAQDYILFGDKAGILAVDRVRVRNEEIRLGLERDRAVRDKKAVNDLGYTTDEQRGINVEAPGAMKRLQDLESERAKNIGAGMETNKKLDDDIAATRKTIQDAAEKVRNARPTPAPKPGAGRPQPTTPGATPGSKGITRSQLQSMVDQYNAKNPQAKASYAKQKANFEARGYKVDESK